jgi:hypothetical protein
MLVTFGMARTSCEGEKKTAGVVIPSEGPLVRTSASKPVKINSNRKPLPNLALCSLIPYHSTFFSYLHFLTTLLVGYSSR